MKRSPAPKDEAPPKKEGDFRHISFVGPAALHFTPTEVRAHYKRVFPAIKHFLRDGDRWRIGNAGFADWYRQEEGRNFLMRSTDEAVVLEKLTQPEKGTLYASLDLYPPGLFNRPKEGEGAPGGYEDIQGFTLGMDLDTRGGHDPLALETIEAKEKAARFIAAELEKMAPCSFYMLDSGGGVYALIHHGLFPPIAEPERSAFFWEFLGRCFNLYLDDLEKRLFEAHQEVYEFVKIDKLNNKKRLFKAPGALHKKLPRAVVPVDPHNIKLGGPLGALPLSDEALKALEAFYPPGGYDPTDAERVVAGLKKFEVEALRQMKEHQGDGGVRVAEVKINSAKFPPCIKKICDPAWQGAETRRTAILVAYLGNAGWAEEEARAAVFSLASAIGAKNTAQIFRSFFRRINCPNCATMKARGGGFPRLSIGPEVCEPGNGCARRTRR